MVRRPILALMAALSPWTAVAAELKAPAQFPPWLKAVIESPVEPGRLEKLIGECPKGICVIKENKGGVSHEFFIAATDAMRRSDIVRIEVAGLCASSCIWLVDIARAKVCLRPTATFGFHLFKPDLRRVPEAERQEHVNRKPYIPPHRKDIIEIVQQHGGFSEKPNVLPANLFSTIWPACPKPVPPPQRRVVS